MSRPKSEGAGLPRSKRSSAPGPRRARPARRAQSAPLSFDEQLVLVSEAMDRDFYADTYRDVATGGLDPANHYLTTGWREGRDPAPWFSTAWYLAEHPQVGAAGVPAFLHYLTEGRRKGWSPRPADWREALRRHIVPVAERVAAARRAAGPIKLSSPAALHKALAGVADAHVTVSHDDYTALVGGVQLCIGREGEGVRGVKAHLHLFPAVRLPTVSDDPDYAVVVLKDGARVGTFPASALAAFADALAPAGRTTLAIHNLLGHHPERLADLLAACRPARSFFWVHDFAAACDGYTLLWNDETFCGGPPRGAPICGTCVYGPLRDRHLDAHDRVLAKLQPTVVAPSAVAAEIWTRARSQPRESVIVHPHAVLETAGDLPQDAGRPVRVAFLGLPLPHKGWPAFAMLAERFAGDPRYEFHHFGDTPDLRAPGITFHRTVVTPQRPTAMTDAVRAHGIDLAVIWSICPETFCLTAHEAAAAGAQLVTFADSGGAAALARRPGLGVVLASEEELMRFFGDAEAAALAHAPRPAAGGLALSGMSMDLMAGHG